MIQYPGCRVLVPTPNLSGVRIFQPAVSGISYLLRDEFITDLPAGSVHGTAAEPGPGTRTVVDTGNMLSVTGGFLTFAGRTEGGDPGYWLDGIARQAGLLLKMHFKGNNVIRLGWDFDQAGSIGGSSYFQVVGVNLKAVEQGNFALIVASISYNTDYSLAIVTRTVGAYWFIRGDAFSNWTLLYHSSSGSDDPMFPGVNLDVSAAHTCDFFRVPDVLWLPTPVAYDSFTRANGPLGTSEATGPDGQAVTGRTWTFDAGVWTVDANQAKASPIAGPELLTNGDFSAWTGDDPDGWLVTESPPYTEISEVGPGEGHGGTGTGLCNLYRQAGYGENSDPNLRVGATVGKWYICQLDIDTITSPGNLTVYDHSVAHTFQALYKTTGAKLFTGVVAYATFRFRAGSGLDATIDNVSLKELTLSELFATVDDGTTTDVLIGVDVTISKEAEAGVVLNLDSASSPANFVVAYYKRDEGRVQLLKCVAGTYTVIIDVVVAYVAGATLAVIKDGTDYSLYYDNVKMGSTSTISDAGIVSNTKHGLFSTYSGNRLDNFTLFPRGTGGEYADLDEF